MTDPLLTAADSVFQYPSSPYTRRHGPCGYSDHTSYKPWLRDEFTFRCVYCLARERWRHDGHGRRFLRLIETLARSESLEAKVALQELLAFPDDFPDLTTKRPPGGNTRPGGVDESCFEKRRRGELPDVY